MRTINSLLIWVVFFLSISSLGWAQSVRLECRWVGVEAGHLEDTKPQLKDANPLVFSETRLKKLFEKAQVIGSADVMIHSDSSASLSMGEEGFARSAYTPSFPKPTPMLEPFFSGLKLHAYLIKISEGQNKKKEVQICLDLMLTTGANLRKEQTLVGELEIPEVSGFRIVTNAILMDNEITLVATLPVRRWDKKATGTQPVLALLIRPQIAPETPLSPSPDTVSQEAPSPEKRSLPLLVKPEFPSLLPEKKYESKEKGISSRVYSFQTKRIELKWVSLPGPLVDQIVGRYAGPTGSISERGEKLVAEAVKGGKGTLDEVADLVICDNTIFAIVAGTETRFVAGYRPYEKIVDNNVHTVLIPDTRRRFTGLNIVGGLWQNGVTFSLAMHLRDSQDKEENRFKVRQFSTELALSEGESYIAIGNDENQTSRKILLIRLVR